MKTLSTALKSHYAAGTTTIATCWRATLLDGTVVAATSLDRDLVIGGVTYKAAQAYNPSDVESASELNPDNLEVEGFLASPSITTEDIHSGRWDFAAIEVFEVNYNNLAAGKNIIRVGTLGEVRGGRSQFTAELRGLMQAYTKTIVRITTKECIDDLGGPHCKIDLTAWTVTGTVGSVTSNRIIADASRTEALDHFTGGKITFTSGANNGLSMEVKKYTAGVIELHQPFYFPIEEGDAYSMHAGCLKRFDEDCGGKFNNKINFYGFPHVPGNDIYRSGMIQYLADGSADPGDSGGPAGDGGGGVSPAPLPSGSYPVMSGPDAAEFSTTPTFYDDFSGSSLKPYWNTEFWAGSGGYAGSWRVDSGTLEMAAITGLPLTGDYPNYVCLDTDPTSGKGASQPFEQKFGVFEVEAQLPAGKGYWPSVWLYAHQAEHRPQISIFEGFAGSTLDWPDDTAPPHPMRAESTIKAVNASGLEQAPGANFTLANGIDLSSTFHKYTCEWDANEIRFFFDGHLVRSVTNPTTLAYLNAHAPLYMVLNFGLGSEAGDRSLNEDVTPIGLGDPTVPEQNTLRINYVAAWQWAKYLDGEGSQSGGGGGATTPPSGSRDPLEQPFASSSIWNTPIGSGAVYVQANLDPTPANNQYAYMPGVDTERICLTPDAPLTEINYSSVAWGGGNRCLATDPSDPPLDSVPMPADFVIPNSNRNEGGVFLRPDGRTIVQAQPIARCTEGGYATALLTFADVDLYGPGITGGHGGSGLSSIGGCIRVGELRPGQQGPKHALKVNVYAKAALYKCATRAQGYRWPATTSDSYAVGWYGTEGNNTNAAMKMGSLLAIPASVDINSLGLVTEPAKQLAWTLQNYGAYIVDDAYAPGFDFSVEEGYHGSKPDEFLADWGFPMAQKVETGSTWVQDIQKLVAALYVVDNNSASSVGGGGTPRQPLAPEISPP